MLQILQSGGQFRAAGIVLLLEPETACSNDWSCVCCIETLTVGSMVCSKVLCCLMSKMPEKSQQQDVAASGGLLSSMHLQILLPKDET